MIGKIFSLSGIDTLLSPVGYLLSPFSNALIARERKIPFTQEEGDPLADKDSTITSLEPTRMEIIIFYLFTGLNLKKVREAKIQLSSRIVTFVKSAEEKPTSTLTFWVDRLIDQMSRFPLVSQETKGSLEEYWVDRYLITSVLSSTEPFNDLLAHQKANQDTSSLKHQFPIEAMLLTRIVSRLRYNNMVGTFPLQSPLLFNYESWRENFLENFILMHEEGTRSWTWKENEKNIRDSRNQKILSTLEGKLSKAVSIQKAWADRKTLHIVENDGYEKLFQVRRVVFHSCWIISAMMIKWITSFVFRQFTK